MSANNKPQKEEKKGGGPVQHREADKNRVSQDEVQLAEVKSRINKI